MLISFGAANTSRGELLFIFQTVHPIYIVLHVRLKWKPYLHNTYARTDTLVRPNCKRTTRAASFEYTLRCSICVCCFCCCTRCIFVFVSALYLHFTQKYPKFILLALCCSLILFVIIF